jgi:hypothetical protein
MDILAFVIFTPVLAFIAMLIDVDFAQQGVYVRIANWWDSRRSAK